MRDIRVAERAVGIFFEDALAGEEAQDAVERVFIDLQLGSQLWNGAPAALQAVGNTETGDSVQGLMKDESVARVEKDGRGRSWRGLLSH